MFCQTPTSSVGQLLDCASLKYDHQKKKIGVVGAALDFDNVGAQSGTCTNYGIPDPFESLCHLSKELVDTLPIQPDY